MPEYIFILGKNAELSLAEISSYLESREVKFSIKDQSDKFVVIEGSIPSETMEALGGTIKIAEVLFSTDSRKFEDVAGEMEQKVSFEQIFKKLPEKTTFGVSSCNSHNEQEFFSALFKKKMKEQGIGAGFVHLPANRSELTHVEVIKRHLIEQSIEFVICSGKKFYLGKTIAVHNPFEFQKRDMERPVQRTIFSIPPRLCRIMINLSGAKSGILLDPFCGVGSVLQEAILMGFDALGIDIDNEAVEDCRENLEWVSIEYEKKFDTNNLHVGDARKLTDHFKGNSIDVIVTEPYLGPPLKKQPTEKEAKEILKELEPLYEKSVASMLSVLKSGGRIVIVAPAFKIGDKIFSLPLKTVKRSFLDYEEYHKTIRQINVIEKST